MLYIINKQAERDGRTGEGEAKPQRSRQQVAGLTGPMTPPGAEVET